MPRKPKNEKSEKGQDMSDEGVKTLKKDDKVRPKDEIGIKKDCCPWCNYENKDEEKGELKDKKKSVVRNRGHKYQCDGCGKFWASQDLNKPWSIELERGDQWRRETKARELSEI